MANAYAGFNPQQLASFFGITPEQATALIGVASGGPSSTDSQTALQGLDPNRFAPSGDIATGLQHLAEHPEGSHYHGDFDIGDIAGNVATGGLYGAAKAGFGAVTGQQDLLSAARSGLNQLGPWGSSTYNIPQYGPQIAETGNLIGAGAGIGGAVGAPFMGALTGLSAEQMMNQFGGQPTPQGGSTPATGGPTTTGGLNAQQMAALSAMNSSAHKGLAPSFEARMSGKSPGPGIAGDAFQQFNQG